MNPKTKQYIGEQVQIASISLESYQLAVTTARRHLEQATEKKVDAPTLKALQGMLRVREMEMANAAAALRAYQNLIEGKEPFA